LTGLDTIILIMLAKINISIGWIFKPRTGSNVRYPKTKARMVHSNEFSIPFLSKIILLIPNKTKKITSALIIKYFTL